MITVSTWWALSDTGTAQLLTTFDETSVNPPNRIESIRCINNSTYRIRMLVYPNNDMHATPYSYTWPESSDVTFTPRNNQDFNYEDFAVTFMFLKPGA